jgi:hypothetical protein
LQLPGLQSPSLKPGVPDAAYAGMRAWIRPTRREHEGAGLGFRGRFPLSRSVISRAFHHPVLGDPVCLLGHACRGVPSADKTAVSVKGPGFG